MEEPPPGDGRHLPPVQGDGRGLPGYGQGHQGGVQQRPGQAHRGHPPQQAADGTVEAVRRGGLRALRGRRTGVRGPAGGPQ